jgi:hypothetical protein
MMAGMASEKDIIGAGEGCDIMSIDVIGALKVMKGLKRMHSTKPTSATVRAFVKAMKYGYLDVIGMMSVPVSWPPGATKPMFKSQTSDMASTGGVSGIAPKVSKFAALKTSSGSRHRST